MSFSSLPVMEVLPRLFDTLEAGDNAVLVVPPGSGKTTVTPLALLELAPSWLGEGRIILVEPRRVAVRGAALRMASLLGEKPGGVVGYRTRLDQAVSEKTRIEVVTAGLFVRRLLSDPFLEGVSAVLFDEVHERSLDGDMGLGFCLDVQRSFRSGLRLVAMSATLEAALFTENLEASLIESAGRSYPVELRYSRDIAHLRDLPEACAHAIHCIWQEEEGSILAFLPGVAEIRRTQALLGEGLPVCLLYGEQSVEEQNRALDPETGRRVVLATSIAETSVTVPGVRVVVDGGWRRLPRRDPSTGLSRLQSRRISRATAEQRAGRAGRQAPGVAVRLWSETTQRSLTVQEVPAIREDDLSDFALLTAAWQATMGTAPEALPLVEAPPAGALSAGQALVQALGGLDAARNLTPLGERMVRFGTHPRLAAMLCAARNQEEIVTAACLAALLEERDPLEPRGGGSAPSADIRLRLALFMHHDERVLRAVVAILRQSAERFMRRAGIAIKGRIDPDPEYAGALIAAGFPDRVAQQAGEGRYRLSGGGSARLSATGPLAREKLLAVAAFHVRKGTDITLAAPLRGDELPPVLRERLVEQTDTTFDGVSGRVMMRQRLRLGVLVLRDRMVTATAEEAAPVLLEKALSDLACHLSWSDAARQMQARVGLARVHYAPHLPDLSDKALAQDGAWLEPYITGYDRLEQLKEIDMLLVLCSCLDYVDMKVLDEQLPSHVVLKTSRSMIDYTATVPSVLAQAQAFYGMSQLPLLVGGKVPLHAVLLSPAGRPQAVTADLARFWKNGWLDMRRDMRGRYPKHDWPEDPVTVALSARKAR